MVGGSADPVEVIGVAGGARLRLRVRPGGRSNRLIGAHGGALKIEVTATPERGKANAAVLQLVARSLEVARTTVEVVAGETSHDKAVLVRGCTADEVVQRLGALGIPARPSHRAGELKADR